jgi:hypothetical protein
MMAKATAKTMAEVAAKATAGRGYGYRDSQDDSQGDG